jgi:putative transposase
MNRNWLPGGTYHVAIRGNNKQVIFYDWDDMDAFIRIITHAYDKFNFQIYAYCIMNNHYHILIRSDQTHLSKIMMNINRRYSDYYRKKYEVVGQIYEKRYYADRVNGPRAFTSISSYIHRNPIDTKIPLVHNMEAIMEARFNTINIRISKTPFS